MTQPAEYLQEAVRSQPLVGQMEIELGRQGERPPRKAILAIRHLSVAIRPPHRCYHRGMSQPIPVHVIFAEETSPPEWENALLGGS